MVNLAEVVHGWERSGEGMNYVLGLLYLPARAICSVWGDCYAFRLAADSASFVAVPLIRIRHYFRRS